LECFCAGEKVIKFGIAVLCVLVGLYLISSSFVFSFYQIVDPFLSFIEKGTRVIAGVGLLALVYFIVR
jgi:hypothetical protein